MTIVQDDSAPLAVVVGATGVQGGSVIDALAESDRPYRIRGFTRDASKPSAEALKKRGVDMMSVNLTVENKEVVLKAFEGATFAFIVTNFWEHMNKEKEFEEGTMMVDAAKHANVKLLVWSGLESMTQASGGKYTHVYHFDNKAAITTYAKGAGIPVVDVQAGMYMQNYLGAMAGPKKQADGSYAIISTSSPQGTVPLIDAVRDYGLFVRKAIEAPKYEPFSTLYTSGEILTHSEIAKQLSELTGKKVAYIQITRDEFNQGVLAMGAPEHIARALYEGYASHEEFGYYAGHDIEPSKQGLARAPRKWSQFVVSTDWTNVLN